MYVVANIGICFGGNWYIRDSKNWYICDSKHWCIYGSDMVAICIYLVMKLLCAVVNIDMDGSVRNDG